MLWLYPYGYHQHRGDLLLYHSDHLGSTSYITDAKPNITQFDVYLPYGELLVDEHTSSEDMPYKFNGKEFDEETGLYYYGARYISCDEFVVWSGCFSRKISKHWWICLLCW